MQNRLSILVKLDADKETHPNTVQVYEAWKEWLLREMGDSYFDTVGVFIESVSLMGTAVMYDKEPSDG